MHRDDGEAQPEERLANPAVWPRHKESQTHNQESCEKEPPAPDEPADEDSHMDRLAEWTASSSSHTTHSERTGHEPLGSCAHTTLHHNGEGMATCLGQRYAFWKEANHGLWCGHNLGPTTRRKTLRRHGGGTPPMAVRRCIGPKLT